MLAATERIRAPHTDVEALCDAQERYRSRLMLDEYVWKAARALFGESNPEAEAWVSGRILALLIGSSSSDIVKTIHW